MRKWVSLFEIMCYDERQAIRVEAVSAKGTAKNDKGGAYDTSI